MHRGTHGEQTRRRQFCAECAEWSTEMHEGLVPRRTDQKDECSEQNVPRNPWRRDQKITVLYITGQNRTQRPKSMALVGIEFWAESDRSAQNVNVEDDEILCAERLCQFLFQVKGHSGWVNVAALQPATCRWVTMVLFNLPLVTWVRILSLLDKKIMLYNLSGYRIILIIVQSRMSPYQQKKVPIFCSHVSMIPCSSDVSYCSHNVHICSNIVPLFFSRYSHVPIEFPRCSHTRLCRAAY
jgi:hypothetical protein